jgi:hypothetical protein
MNNLGLDKLQVETKLPEGTGAGCQKSKGGILFEVKVKYG